MRIHTELLQQTDTSIQRHIIYKRMSDKMQEKYSPRHASARNMQHEARRAFHAEARRRRQHV
jgi:hypothetical protein